MWVFYSVSCILTAIICISLGIFVYIVNRKSIINKRFAIVSLLIGIWCLFSFLTSIIDSKESALFWGRLVYMAAFFAPAAFVHFVFVTLNIHERKFEKLFIRAAYFISILFCFIAFSPLFIKDIIQRSPSTKIVAGPLYLFFILFFVSLCPYAIYQIYTAFKNSVGYKREQLKFLFLGFFIALISGVMHILSPYSSIEIFPHDLLLIIWSIIISYAILKYRLMDIRFAVTTAGLFILVYTIVLGIPFYVAYRTGSGLLATSFAVILASIGPVTYRRLHKKAEEAILAGQKRYQDALRQASAGMVREHNLDRLLNLVVTVLSNVVKINYVDAFIDNPDDGSYQLKASNQTNENRQINVFRYSDPLIKYLKLVKQPITFEELPDYLKESLARDNLISLIVPSFIEDKLLGFIILGEKVNKTMFTQDDIDVFKTLSNQLALAIENCLYLEESKKTQEKLFAAEKLASIGGMAEGIAHQIMNRLNQFSLNSQAIEVKLERFHKDKNEDLFSKELGDISNSLMKNVTRTTDIVKGILNYSNIEINERDFSNFSINEIINPSLELLKIKHNLNKFLLNLEITEGDGVLYGVKAQLMEVMYNLLDNAYEATKEKQQYLMEKGQDKEVYKPEIKISLAQDEVESKNIIEIKDNGIGIKEENKSKIFAPFYTTKPGSKSGSGIGMYIAKRMVEEKHNGKIWFYSEFMKGTIFSIELPNNKIN
jgi:signal transduction histidine kinase